MSLPGIPPRDEFDEEAYLQLNPDVAAAIGARIVDSGWQHFTLHGHRENRPWRPQPNRMAGVIAEISPQDEMFLGDRDHYFDVGESALRCLKRVLAEAQGRPDSIRRILDLPCGHGRALRFIKPAFPRAHLTACDLNADGVAFCAKTFDAEPIVSRTNIDAIALPAPFDLIWCGSLLTHLPAAECGAFLRLFQRALTPGGILVFTLHGRSYEKSLLDARDLSGLSQEQVAALLAQYRAAGFGYVDYAGQTGYGFSMTHPTFVKSRLLTPGWRFLSHHEQAWDKRQDVVAFQSAADDRVAAD